MTIFTELKSTPSFLEELSVGLDLTLGAVAEETFVRNPIASALRATDMTYEPGSRGRIVKQSPLIPAEDARKKIKDLNLDLTVPDTGIEEESLNSLIELKKDEVVRQSIISRGPTDLYSTVAKFGVSLGVSAMDPLNIASAFIPVIGEARYTALIANATGGFGKAVVRAGVGATEGAVGAALIEPIVLGVATYEQADYTLSDSLENVFFGSVLGGGLHVGVGAFSDALSKGRSIHTAQADGKMAEILSNVSPATRNSAAQSALAQFLDGRKIDVESILELDPRYATLNNRLLGSSSLVPTRVSNVPFTAPEVVIYRPGMEPISIATPGSAISESARTTVGAQTGTGELRTFQTAEEAQNIVDAVQRRSGEVLTVEQLQDGSFALKREFADQPIRNGDGNIIAFETERLAVKESGRITGLKDKNLTPIPFLDNGKIKFALVENADPKFVEAAKANPDLVSFNIEKETIANTGYRSIQPTAEQIAKIQQASLVSFSAENSRLADPASSSYADELIKRTSQVAEDVDMAQQQIDYHVGIAQAHATQRGTPEMMNELKEFDDLIVDADNFGKAISAAFNCQIRRGI